MKIQIIIFVLYFITKSNSVLQVRPVNTRLPFALNDPITVYDGDDSIYLFGGYDKDFYSRRDIIKFSISTETITVLEDTLPVSTYGAAGSACMDTLNSEIFLISSFLQDGVGYFTDVFRLPINAANQTLINDGRHRIGMPYSYTLCDKNGRVFNANYYSGVFRYFQTANLFQTLLLSSNVTRNGAVIYDQDSDVAYIFGGVHYPTPHDEIVKFTPGPPARTELLDVKLPAPRTEGAVAWDGRYAYVSAGVNVYYANFYRFDPQTGNITTLQTQGFPEGDYRNSATASVYVPKMNAIYVFGGVVRSTEFVVQDTIWAISLDEDL